MITHVLFAALCIAETVPVGPRDPMLPLTTPPIIYTIDYSGRWVANPERFKRAPPDLLHVGEEAVPILQASGPVEVWGGGGAYRGLLTPEALAQRIEHIRKVVARCHAIGIRQITPYICCITLIGDHQKRLGFWDFYDHWDRYAKWVGPRPPHDPYDWTVRDLAGKYWPETGFPYSSPYFAPFHRYNTCLSSPNRREWHRRVIRMIAQVGYDGCFIDNTSALNCYCNDCRMAFRDFLTVHRNIDWVRRLSAGLRSSELTIESPKFPPELFRRWRMLEYADHMRTLQRAGREVKPDFVIFPNANDIQKCLVIGTQCDRLMVENTSLSGLLCADRPPETAETVVPVAKKVCVDHVAELLYTQHMHARTIYLDAKTSAAYSGLGAGPILGDDRQYDNVQELGLAEMAAFGGGGGFGGGGPPQALYRLFFRKYPDLYVGWRPTAPAAVLYAYWGNNPLDPSPAAQENPHRLSAPPRIHDCLTAGHRPFVALIDNSLPDRADELAGFAVIYLESPAYDLSLGQLRALREYAGRGRLVLVNKDVAINGHPAIKLLGSDRVTFWDPKKPTTPTAAVAPVEGILKNLRFALYEKKDRLTVHVVNYNVCLLDPTKTVLEVAATPLVISLPAGWKAANATCFDPNAAPQTLPCTVDDGVARLTLPKLHIYKLVLLERR